ncbi:MAG: ABC transporter permease [Gemmatimonadales bacterium]
MDTITQDLRYALRQLGARPGFTAIVVGTLAIGIGANTAIFSAIDAAVLRPPPFHAPDELRVIRPILQAESGEIDTLRFWSYPMFEAFRDAEPAVGTVAAYTPRAGAYNLETTGEPTRARVEFVSGTYFGVLGVPAQLGRTFMPADDQVPNARAVAVLSHEAWTRFFGADSGVIGQTIRLNTVSFEVMGVAEAGFEGVSGQADVWLPMMMAPTLTFPRRLAGALSFWHAVIARAVIARVPRGSEAALPARLAARARAVAPQLPLAEGFGPVTLEFTGVPLATARVSPAVRTALHVLMGAVAFVLLIVCVNVANLLLTQAARRRRELSVRIALGAGRGAIARVILTESLVLGLVGGVLALVVATWMLGAVRAIAPAMPPGVADPASASLGAGVLVFNFVVAALAGVLVGVLPTVRVSRIGAQAVLKEEDRHAVGSGRARSALIAAEVALALVLLTGAGLMLRSLMHLHAVDPGFTPERLLTANVSLPRQAYQSADAVRFLDAARERLRAMPGVEAVTVAYCLPVAGGCDNVGMEIRGAMRDPDAPPPPVAMNMVDGGYFRTMGIPLIRGRTFEQRDRGGAPRVAVLSHTAAEQYWPNGDALGARMRLTVGWDADAEVVGIVDDVRMGTLDAPPPPLVYLPYQQQIYNSNYLIARTTGPPLAFTDVMRGSVHEVDPALPLWDVQTMEERIGQSVADTRFTAVLLGAAAAIAMLVAALGVFGVMAFAIAGRTRELGVRMALGARHHDVMTLVLAQGMRAVAVGVVLGIGGAWLVTRVLASQLHGVTATDPAAFAGATAVMALAALAAAYLPARRATRIDPMVALRTE